jgi:hypothetical protein
MIVEAVRIVADSIVVRKHQPLVRLLGRLGRTRLPASWSVQASPESRTILELDREGGVRRL